MGPLLVREVLDSYLRESRGFLLDVDIREKLLRADLELPPLLSLRCLSLLLLFFRMPLVADLWVAPRLLDSKSSMITDESSLSFTLVSLVSKSLILSWRDLRLFYIFWYEASAPMILVGFPIVLLLPCMVSLLERSSAKMPLSELCIRLVWSWSFFWTVEFLRPKLDVPSFRLSGVCIISNSLCFI